MDFKYVPKEYRPIPFWSWNDKLETDETARQVNLMSDVGMGGFFMHARGGLKTEYMGDEWFENINSAIKGADENSMDAWAYDENGWPSGFGDSKVSGMGVNYQQKYLRLSKEKPQDNIICETEYGWLYYELNPFYIDVLDKNVVKEFINVAYQPYYDRFKNKIKGFFTDEPQVSRDGIPWSFVFEGEYKKRYNADLKMDLIGLYEPIKGYKTIRIQFWSMVTDLFSESYFKQIYDWCDERNLKLTGHLTLEETLSGQLTCNGACMPHYEYFHIPGIDWLGRNTEDCLIQRQMASVAQQLGKKQIICETFGLCGHGVSFEELKGIFDWHAAYGINLLCQHLEGYSIRGMRKRDYPPAMYFQQPWWNEYKIFIDSVAREGMILSEGEDCADVLVIHPQTTAWTLFDGSDNNVETEKLDARFLSEIKKLEKKNIQFHLGDETIIKRHAYVDGMKFVIGNKGYSKVINPCGEELFDTTKRLLDEFVKNGGILTSVENIKGQRIVTDEEIKYTVRKVDGGKIHFFVNASADIKDADVYVNGRVIDVETGEMKAFSGHHRFYAYESLMIYEDGSQNFEEEQITEIRLTKKLTLNEKTENMLTLDKCDYYFDGELQEKKGYVLNICERANKLERKVNIHQDYYLNIEYIPDELYLVCEAPERFKIKINSFEIKNSTDGYIIDRCFEKIDISKYVTEGLNIISFDCEFEQSAKVYESIKKAWIFESEKNKLAYDFEIEPIYIMGDFGVCTSGVWENLDKNAVRYRGGFVIGKQKNVLNPQNIEQQGFPFFCGALKCQTEIDIKGNNPVLVLDKKGFNAVIAKINGREKVSLNGRINLKDFDVHGVTRIELTLINNLRNLMGPHHINIGESYYVWPGSFVKERCIWDKGTPEKNWDGDYCFTETGV